MSHSRRRPAAATTAVATACALAATALLAPGSRAALPPRYGGSLRLPSPSPLVSLDPATALEPFSAWVAAAVFDPLYRVDGSGMLRPVLADGMPSRSSDGASVLVKVRAGVRFHHGRGVTAGDVVATLRRAGASETSAWAIAPLVRRGTQPEVRALDRQTVELRTTLEPLRLARLLAVPTLAIVPARFDPLRPSGTGAFRVAALRGGGIVLSAFRDAAEGGPYLDRISFDPPRSRNDEVRALELGAIDGSWIAASLYRRTASRPIVSFDGPPLAPVLLVLNPSRPALREPAFRAHVAAAVERHGLGPAGIVPRADLAGGSAGIAARRSSAAERRTPLVLPVSSGDAVEQALAELLVAQLDDAGIALQVEPVPAARYPGRVAAGDFDLRIATCLPMGADAGGEVAAALAAAGQGVRAAALAVAAPLWDVESARAAARELSAIVLGRRRVALHARADLRGVRFDPLGRLMLAELWLGSAQPAAHAAGTAAEAAP